MMKNKIILFLCLTVFYSCSNNNSVFEQYKSIPKYKWYLNDTISFDVDIKDTLNYKNIFINIRNSTLFPKSNIWLFVNTTDTKGQIISDTINCYLADKTGKWLGSGFGDIFDNSFVLKENILFPHKGKYHFDIIHGLRDNPIKGINDIGLKIENITENN